MRRKKKNYITEKKHTQVNHIDQLRSGKKIDGRTLFNQNHPYLGCFK